METKFKKGDWVIILESNSNFSSEMRKWIGQSFQIQSTQNGKETKFESNNEINRWEWNAHQNHFRLAQEHEIPIEYRKEVNLIDNFNIF